MLMVTNYILVTEALIYKQVKWYGDLRNCIVSPERANSSAVELLVYTESVGGSIPSSPIIKYIMAKPTKEEIIDLLYENYSDYHTLPHYGLVPDWYLRYWELHNMIFDYLEDDT